MVDSKRSKTFLELFKFSEKDKHFYEQLESSFWDTENIIVKKYKGIKDKLNLNNDVDELKYLEKAYKIILNTKFKNCYEKYLMYEYTISQPRNLNQLIENYYSVIFPYYLFLLKNANKEDHNYVILDNINFSLNYYEKNGLKSSFEVASILDIKLIEEKSSIEIKIVNNKNKLVFIPILEDQLEYLYTLILFMLVLKNKKDNKKKDLSKVNEINQNLTVKGTKTLLELGLEIILAKLHKNKLLVLSNDSFVPHGIKLSTIVTEKSLGTVFFVLGSTYIFLFKNQLMNDILNIIPIEPGEIIFVFIENEKNIKIKKKDKEINFFFQNSESYTGVKKIINKISEDDEEYLTDEDIVKVSESLYNDQIMGGEFKDTPLYCKAEKDLKLLDIKMEYLKNAKLKLEKKYQDFK